MSLIAIAIHDTEDNDRTRYTKQTLISLLDTVNFTKHRLFLIDNNSCQATKDFINIEFKELFEQKYWGQSVNQYTVITNEENIGTAEAINKAWKFRLPDEPCVKMDNDVVIHCNDWVEQLEEAIKREPKIGICALKRRDLEENPSNTNPDWKSELIMLPHRPYEKWIVVEKVKHVMGTCTMFNPKLLKRIGYLYQPFVYAFDDTLVSWRSTIAGYMNCFLPTVCIDHIDEGGTEYIEWKKKVAGEYMQQMVELVDDYTKGRKDIRYDPFAKELTHE